MTKKYDAIIIGAGHNGLTNAAYLAKAGLDVLVVEKNDYIGGASVSREMHKGWIYSSCSYVCSMMRQAIHRDLDLSRHGLMLVPYLGTVNFGDTDERLFSYHNEEAAHLELKRDEQLRAVQTAEDRYQICKDLSDNLTVGYNTSEVVMARLLQTTTAKERVYSQAVSFFSTNEIVLTALSASFTGMFGLHEGTQTVEAMKEGVSRSLEDLAEIGGKVQEAAVRAGYGPTVRADAVKKLVDSVVNWQTRSREIIEEMRVQSTANAEEIRVAVEEGKRNLARLAEEGKGLLVSAE